MGPYIPIAEATAHERVTGPISIVELNQHMTIDQSWHGPQGERCMYRLKRLQAQGSALPKARSTMHACVHAPTCHDIHSGLHCASPLYLTWPEVQTLELVMMCKEAHDKQRIHCLAAGKDGFLYSGGEDKVGGLL